MRTQKGGRKLEGKKSIYQTVEIEHEENEKGFSQLLLCPCERLEEPDGYLRNF